METKLIDNNFDKDLFDSKATYPLQCWEWGEAKKELGNEVIRVGEFDGDELLNVFQLTLHEIPKTSYKIAYLPRSVFPSEKTITFLKEFASKNKIVFIKLEPNVAKKDAPKVLPPDMVKSNHPLLPAWTQILDLKPSEEELLKNLKQKTRYNIRLAEKKGVTVKEESNEEGFKKFSKLYFETTKRQKYLGHDKHYHEVVWNHMKNGHASILIAYFEEEPLAAYEHFHFDSVQCYTYGGSSDKHRNVMAANLLMWESIKLGKRLGAERYDMFGSLPPTYDPNDPWAGFTRFKEGYGTEFFEFMGTYDLIVNKPLYTIYGVLNTIRNIFLKLKT